ncbi:MAG: outer membrane protein assembly factor BamD [bacterium]
MKKIIIFSILSAIFLVSCKTPDYKLLTTAKSVFETGKKLYKEKDYLEAQSLFEKIKLQFPASIYSDSSQYYLGEIYFSRKEYILAAYSYSLLERNYPASLLRKDARYKNALCYYKLSPDFDRDQEYTKKAIDLFNNFKELHPGDSLFFDAQKKVSELTKKLAQKDFATAELYAKIEEPKAAIIYYNSIIENYVDSEYFEQAFTGKIKSQILMESFEKARSTIDLYKKRFPENANRSDIKEFERLIATGINPPQQSK